MKERTKLLLFLVVLVAILGMAGRSDYTEAALSEMTDDTYNEIKDTLHGASDYEIAKYYFKHKNDYEPLNIGAELPE